MILGGSITSALTSFAGLGLALILERDGAECVRLGWTDANEPRMVVSAEEYDDEAIAAAVHRHAIVGAAPNSWMQADLAEAPWNGRNAVFSPRVKTATTEKQWHALQLDRHRGIDRETEDRGHEIDVELIGALGEPAYWRHVGKSPRPDEGANRWEMKTRNRGEDFVRNRLRQLAKIVAARDASLIRSGLTGEKLVDEAYKNKRSDDSRTATGLTAPRFTDSALAWCALWGISSFPVIHRLAGPSVTAGAVPIGRFAPEKLILPVLVGAYSLERWRALILSEELSQAEADADVAVRGWLASHGVRAVVSFRLHISDNKSAPEHSLGAGRVKVLA